MKRILVGFITASFLTVSCGKSGGGSDSVSNTPVSTTSEINTDKTTANDIPITPASDLPELALTFQTNIDMMDFTNSQETKYAKAVAIVKKVISTEAFRNRVLNFTYNGIKQFANNNGLTNEEIYESVLDAAESLHPIKNNTMDLGVKMYYENSTVIGYTNPDITYINVNTKFFNSFDPNEVAGNLFHEWLHKIGYGHDYSSTARRPYSVPYAIGYIVRDLGKSFL